MMKPKITKAMIMAAGHGTRMYPLTRHMSKAMVEIDGRPLIDHMLERVSEAGIEQAVVNVHAHADHLEAHLKARLSGPEIIISDERDALLETGGGIVKALPLLGSDPILICNIDAIWLENTPLIPNLMKQWDPTRMDDLLVLAPKDQTLGYSGAGDFHLKDNGKIVRRTQGRAEYVYAGVQIARLEPFDGWPCEPFSRNKIWDEALKTQRIYGHVLDGFWMHVGDPDALVKAQRKLDATKQTLQP